MNSDLAVQPVSELIGNEEDNRAKLYAVVAYLPSDLEEVVASLRERFDPDYNLISAHLTLVFPFKTRRSIEELSAPIQSVVQGTRVIEVNLDSIGDFYPKTPVIYWQVRKNEELNRLHRRLYAALDLPLPFRELIPHVTVAKEISHHRVMLVKDKIADYLTRETFDVETVELVSPVADDHWLSVRTFSLIAGSQTSTC